MNLRRGLIAAGVLTLVAGAGVLVLGDPQTGTANGLMALKAGAIIVGLGFLAPQPDRD